MFAREYRSEEEEVQNEELAANATLRVEPGRHGVALRAEQGLLWVTQAGDPLDHVLGSGQVLRLPRGGLVVALALAPSRLTVRPARAGHRPRRGGLPLARATR